MREDDLPGRIGELIRYGRIASVDLEAGTISVSLGEIETQPILWITGGSGGTRFWSRPKVGEQVMLIAPEGDIAGAIAIRGVACDAFPMLRDPVREVVEFEDGAAIAYDPAGHILTAVLPDGATVRIVAPGGVTIDADVRITGDVQVDGKLTATDDVIGGGKSLKSHKHLGVTAGGAVSGLPE